MCSFTLHASNNFSSLEIQTSPQEGQRRTICQGPKNGVIVNWLPRNENGTSRDLVLPSRRTMSLSDSRSQVSTEFPLLILSEPKALSKVD
jgi:hypothetical protein